MRSKDSQELEKIIQICQHNLSNSEECQSYLKETRGLSDELIEKYRFGYFPRNVNKLLEYVEEESLLRLGIISSNRGMKYSKFSDNYYMVMPIFSEYGVPMGIFGRTLLSDYERKVLRIPKYKNSIYKKSKVLFGLNLSREEIIKKNRAYVVEGQFDHIALRANGIKNVVATCSAGFSRSHFIKLSRYTKNIYFIPDNDDAGKKSIDSNHKKFSGRGIGINFLKVPDTCKDIDDYLSLEGKSYRTLVKEIKKVVPTASWK